MGLLDSVERLHTGLDYHLSRANLLTANLGHVDTPNYKPVDLTRGADFSKALHVEMQATQAGHMASSRSATSSPTGETFHVVTDPGAAAGADGNGVNIDREAAKIAANNVRYDALASLVSGELGGLSWAVNDGKGG